MKIGNATILNIDCMEYLATLPDKAFELALVDPPYGIGMSGGNVGCKGFNNLERKEWDKEIPPREYFDELERVSKNQIIWGGNYFHLRPTRGFIVWDKGAGFKGRTYAECEFAWTSFDANARIYLRDPLAMGDYKGKIHPTQKPYQLYEFILTNYAKPGDRILDTHLGSGSSAIAANNLGFEFVGCELDADYYAAACKRIEHHTKQMRLFA
jgi:site-specific DNA-methyltransferase (adenine-specific)